MQLKTKDLAAWLGLSPATIRLWTSEPYGDFLSPVGQGGDGRTRSFNEHDARIIAFIHALKQQGQEREEIMTTLKQLESESWRDLPPMPQAPPGVVTEVVNAETAQNALTTQRNALLREIAILEERVENLEGDIQQERIKRETVEKELASAREQLGELRGQLKERPSAAYWLRIIAATVGIMTIIAAIAVVYLSSRG